VNHIIPAILGLFAILWYAAIFSLAPKVGLVKLNYKKAPIMTSYGIVSFVYMAAVMLGLAQLHYADMKRVWIYLAPMSAMWALGIIDDIWGTRDVGGFKGHFKRLLFERRLTTGAVKAIGGGMVGIVAGWYLSGGSPLKWILAAMLIPLASNILNLFDLRPGRAVAVFFFGLGVICIAVGSRVSDPWLVGSVAAVTLMFSVMDSSGRAMMGDSGSNTLGAALGLTMVLSTGPVFQILAVVIIIAVHLYSEKRSMSALIERNSMLRFIDRRLGVR
jgi:UDP-GlcNAc:undecaprenyl-phosphate GlcNAc-1-phosphate transferase